MDKSEIIIKFSLQKSEKNLIITLSLNGFHMKFVVMHKRRNALWSVVIGKSRLTIRVVI